MFSFIETSKQSFKVAVPFCIPSRKVQSSHCSTYLSTFGIVRCQMLKMLHPFSYISVFKSLSHSLSSAILKASLWKVGNFLRCTTSNWFFQIKICFLFPILEFFFWTSTLPHYQTISLIIVLYSPRNGFLLLHNTDTCNICHILGPNLF